MLIFSASRELCTASATQGRAYNGISKKLLLLSCSLFEPSELKPHPPLSPLDFVSPSSFADFLVLIRGLREEVWMWKQAPFLSTSLTAILLLGLLGAEVRILPDWGDEVCICFASCLLHCPLALGLALGLSPSVGVPLLQSLICLGDAAHCSSLGWGGLLLGLVPAGQGRPGPLLAGLTVTVTPRSLDSTSRF